MASLYERELKAVLAGSADGVRAVTRSCTPVEKARAMQVIRRPFLVVRAAGSGCAGAGDLLAVRGDISFPIEVKSTKKKKLYLSGRLWQQYCDLKKEAERCGLMPIYAMRLKGVRGDSWRILRIKTESLSGKLSVIGRTVPALPLTKTGKPHLDWDAGLPLHKFLALLCRDEESYSRTAEVLLAKVSEFTRPSEKREGEASVVTTTPEHEREAWMGRFRL